MQYINLSYKTKIMTVFDLNNKIYSILAVCVIYELLSTRKLSSFRN